MVLSIRLSATPFSQCSCGWELEAFLRWWPPSTVWAGPLVFLWPPPGGVWIIPSFRIWGYVLYVEHILCVITNCGQHQWAIPSLFSIALEALLEENITRKLLSLSLDFIEPMHHNKPNITYLLSLDLVFQILLFQVTFLIFLSIAVFSP